MPIPKKPYIMLVSDVTKANGSGITNASVKFINNTKSTDKTVVSNESDSNTVLNLSELGSWSNGDIISVEVTYRNTIKRKSHIISAGDHNMYNFGSIQFQRTNKVISNNMLKISGISKKNINCVGGILT